MKKKSILFGLNIILLFMSWLMALTDYNTLTGPNLGYGAEAGLSVETNPFTFFLMPVIQSIVVLLILVLVHYPQLYNFPQKKEVRKWPAEYRKPVYEFLEFCVMLVALFLNVMFILIQNLIIEHGEAVSEGSSRVWLLVAMIFIWLPFLIYFLVRIGKVVERQRHKLAFESNGQSGE